MGKKEPIFLSSPVITMMWCLITVLHIDILLYPIMQRKKTAANAFILLAVLYTLFFIPACKTKPAPLYTDYPASAVVMLDIPSRNELVYKNRDPDVQSELERGSPDSIRQAVQYLYRSTKGFDSTKQRDISFATRLMHFLYPLAPVDWNFSKYTVPDAQLDALSEIENGIYPQSLGMDTFWDALIPAFILAKGVNFKEHIPAIEKRLYYAQRLNPNSVLPVYFFGLLYEQQNRLSDAQAAYQIAWEYDESCYPAGIRFAKLALQAGNIEAALHVAHILHERYPEATLIRLLFAETLIEAGRWTEVEPIVQAVLKNTPEQKEAVFLRTRIHIEKKEYLPAMTLIDGYGKKNRTDKNYLLLRMRILTEWSRNTAEAVRCLEQAERLYPYANDVLLACAEMCFYTNNTINGKTADDFIDALLLQDNKNSAAIRLLVKQDIKLERWAKAFDRSQYLYTVLPSEEHQVLFITASIGMRNWEGALTVIRSVYAKQDKPSDTILALYLEALYGSGDHRTLRQVITAKLPAARSSLKATLLYYQALLEQNGEKKLALLRLSLLSNPRNEPTLYALYKWYFADADYRKAQYYLQQVLLINKSNTSYTKEAEKLNRLLAK